MGARTGSFMTGHDDISVLRMRRASKGRSSSKPLGINNTWIKPQVAVFGLSVVNAGNQGVCFRRDAVHSIIVLVSHHFPPGDDP